MCKSLATMDIWHYVILTKKILELLTIYIQLYTVTAVLSTVTSSKSQAVQHVHNELNRECIVVTRKGSIFCPYLTPHTFSVAVIKNGLQR